MHLIKLLYYADRKAILEFGRPITGDQMTSMDWGPVLSDILDYVRGRQNPGPNWQEYISQRRSDYTVAVLKASPETDTLSKYELDVLVEIDKAHGWKDRFDFSAESHRLPEWTDPNGSSIPIDIEDILRSERNSDREIADVTDTARVDWFFKNLDDDTE
jgi:hypothetical protein